jgi:cyclophilin family peptidyl-prolyl cis-trans isomerase
MTRISIIAFILVAICTILPAQQTKGKRALQKQEQKKERIGTPYGTIVTNMGTIEIKLYDRDAPKTVVNFVGLAEKGYYNNVTFHRVSKGFVIQGGDPTGTGTGGESIYGGPFEDELNPSTPSYKEGYVKGVVAMANAGPHTNTSQFFIMLSSVPQMPKAYSIFGKVTKGIEVVDAIGKLETVPPYDGKPIQKVVMQKVTIEYR